MLSRLLIIILLLLVSCQNKTEQKVTITKNVSSQMDMYKTSEMAELMRLMEAENQLLRHKIMSEQELGAFVSQFNKIHNATLTDPSDLDADFKVKANDFITLQKAIFTAPKQEQKTFYNNAVKACVACHVGRCEGPIPRIEKLLIP